MVLESCACLINALLLTKMYLASHLGFVLGFQYRLKSVEHFVVLGVIVVVVLFYSKLFSFIFWQQSLRHPRLFPLSTSIRPLSGKSLHMEAILFPSVRSPKGRPAPDF